MKANTRSSTADLKALVSPADLLRRHGSSSDGQDRWRCPFSERHRNGDAHHSVTIKNERAYCWSQGCLGEKGADIFELVKLLEGFSTFREQRSRIEEMAGLVGSEPGPTRTLEYEVRDQLGTLLAVHVRTERGESKSFHWRQPDGKLGLNGIKVEDLPLYGSDIEWDADRPIILVEGEKAAEALWAAGQPALGTVTGAYSTPSPGALSILRGRHVYLWPDNDDPGRQHIQRIAARLATLAASVHFIAWLQAGPKEDAVDFIRALGPRPTQQQLDQAIEALIADAEPWFSENRKPGGLCFTSLADLLVEPEESTAWLLEGRLPAGGLSLFAGKPKAGKSTAARGLALAVARGAPFLTFGTLKGPVLYLALEEKRAEVRRHFKDMGATGNDPIFTFCAPSPADGVPLLRQAAEQYKPVLIIVDPLFKIVRVKDGNDYAQVTAAIEPLLTLARETGAHVLAVHHLGKGDREGGESILGSTAILAAVDTALLLKRSEKYRTLSSIQRYGTDLEEITLTLHPETRMVEAGPAREEADRCHMEQTLLEFLRLMPEPVEERVILDQVEGRRGLKVKALRALVEVGSVTKTGKGGKADPFRYGVTPDRAPSPEHGNRVPEPPVLDRPETPISGSCSVVPIYIWEQENKNPEIGVTPQKDEVDSCTQETGLFDAGSGSHASTREQESFEVDLDR